MGVRGVGAGSLLASNEQRQNIIQCIIPIHDMLVVHNYNSWVGRWEKW